MTPTFVPQSAYPGYVPPTGSAFTGGTNYSLTANDAASQAANYARAAYDQALAAGYPEAIAIQKAQEAWTEKYQTAQLLGTLNGQDTLPKIAQDAALSGLQANGKPTEAARQFNVTESGMLDNAPTVNEQQVQNSATQNYLNLLASLKGPQNAFQYAKVLGGTPRGLVDIVNAASGRLNMPMGAGANLTPAQSGGSTTNNPAGMSVGADGNLTSASPQGLISDMNNPGQAAPPTTSALPAPNQIDPLAWQRFGPTQKALALADYQDQGWDPNDVTAMRQASLPGFRNATRGGVTGLFGG